MIAYDNDWPRAIEVFFTRDDIEAYSCGQAHGILKGAGGEILGDSMLSNKTQEN